MRTLTVPYYLRPRPVASSEQNVLLFLPKGSYGMVPYHNISGRSFMLDNMFLFIHLPKAVARD